ncbi:hypothetical protein [Streptococcus hyovaginalis]|uniref:hypothetical protein n=1 Tax=Streptococcus hyovaginalis TaxID=149015 RepID=UPI002A91C673|nr:hypothetical protein [Streptococcus hyovaginalis]MDY5973736.1 hypothetical protein [Streptococcus hyovaginalis]
MEIKLSSSAETSERSEPRPKPSAVMKTLETSAFQVFGVFRAKKVWETFLGCRMETRKRQKAQIFSLGAYLLGIKKDRNNGIDLW